jgi:CheY-like chemotaxis protein
MVLLDLNMPRMNGIEFLEAIRQDPQLKTVPVVVLTTSSAEEDRLNAYRHNVAGYIVKPVQFDSFAHTMATLTEYWNLCEFP